MRTSWNAVPDRGGHAYNKDPQAVVTRDDGSAADRKTIMREDVPQGDIQGAERYYTFESGDRLYKVAQRYGISLYWLIKRNDLSDLPHAGQKLIVPGPAIQ